MVMVPAVRFICPRRKRKSKLLDGKKLEKSRALKNSVLVHLAVLASDIDVKVVLVAATSPIKDGVQCCARVVNLNF